MKKIYGIVGHPVEHSLSPAMHNAAFRAQMLNFRYLPLDTPAARGLADLKRLTRGAKFRGFSVTAPWKIAIMKHLDAVEPLARSIGAVNTVLSDGKRLLGFNTDASGGMEALREKLESLGRTPRGLRAAVVGAGGAARAMAHAAVRSGMEVLVSSRRPMPGRALARSVRGRWVPLPKLSRETYEILIHCTPVGTVGKGRAGAKGIMVPPAAIKGLLESHQSAACCWNGVDRSTTCIHALARDAISEPMEKMPCNASNVSQ